MANNKNKERETEYFLHLNNRDASEDDHDIDGVKYESESSHNSEGGSGSCYMGGRRTQNESFASQQWPQSYKYKSSLPCVYLFAT